MGRMGRWAKRGKRPEVAVVKGGSEPRDTRNGKGAEPTGRREGDPLDDEVGEPQIRQPNQASVPQDQASKAVVRKMQETLCGDERRAIGANGEGVELRHMMQDRRREHTRE